eukprot:6188935-Pleurochrysis_carterae.AAC.1
MYVAYHACAKLVSHAMTRGGHGSRACYAACQTQLRLRMCPRSCAQETCACATSVQVPMSS